MPTDIAGYAGPVIAEGARMSPDIELSAADLEALRRARKQLEQPGIAIQLANLAGAPLERVLHKRLPATARRVVDRAVRRSMDAACRVALSTLKDGSAPAASRDVLHRLAVVATGAAGGFFGLAGVPVELPVTTTAMLRSILDIARGEGERLDDAATRVACLEVLALGGSSRADDAADTGYFAVRAALAQQVSAAVNHLAGKGMADRGAPVMIALVSRIAAYFSIPVSEKLAAQGIPVIGALSGSVLNVVFITHFQKMAHGHFTVRRLERQYGDQCIRDAYAALGRSDRDGALVNTS